MKPRLFETLWRHREKDVLPLAVLDVCVRRLQHVARSDRAHHPYLTRVAFALAKGDPDNEQGWVAVSDSLSGGSKLIVTGKPGEYFTVASWLNADTLLLQSNSLTCNPTCTNSLWVVKVDGSGLTHITDGTFLGLMD